MTEEDAKTLWCGNLSEQVSEEILYELFLQAGPLEKVRIPRDRDGRQKNFAFITFSQEVSVPYAINLFRGTALFNRTLMLQSRGRMPLLPPPIRCYGVAPPLEFEDQDQVVQQFYDMTEQLSKVNPPVHQPRHESNDQLVMASLQGNWSHRHHPYRSKDKPHVHDDYRPRDRDRNNRSKHQNSWRDRQSHRNYRRD